MMLLFHKSRCVESIVLKQNVLIRVDVLCCVVFEGWRVRQARLDHRRGVVEALQHEGQERAGREPVRAVQEHPRVRAVWKGVRACVREKRSRFDRYVVRVRHNLVCLPPFPLPPFLGPVEC